MVLRPASTLFPSFNLVPSASAEADPVLAGFVATTDILCMFPSVQLPSHSALPERRCADANPAQAGPRHHRCWCCCYSCFCRCCRHHILRFCLARKFTSSVKCSLPRTLARTNLALTPGAAQTAMAQSPNPFSEDVLLNVLRILDVRTLALSGLVCRAWREQVRC